MLALQLLRLPAGVGPLDVVMVEPREQLGPGTAYSNDRPEWLLNVRSSGLSAFPDQPNHFVDWLREQGLPDCPHGFCARQTYGRYLESLVQAALHEPTAHGGQLRWLRQRAVQARPLPTGNVHLELSNGSTLEVNTLVLALGNFPPPAPVRPDHGYAQHPRFHANPWTYGALRDIQPDASVLLIGTGLTAVDALVALRTQNHRGPLLAVSRHGRWPAPHLPAPAPSYPSFYAAELAGLGTVGEVLRAVRRRVALAAAEGHNWRSVLDALRPDSGRIWAAWSLPEQQRFVRHLANLWSTLRHRNPPQNAALLAELLGSGQLTVHKGRVRHIEPRGEQQLGVQLRYNHDHHWLQADHVVLCTGPLMDYQQLADPLVASLRHAGRLVPDHMRLGIATDAYGALLDVHSQPAQQLFTLGPSLRPLLFESTAVPELRQQAVDLARLLGQRLAESAPAANPVKANGRPLV